MIDNDQTLRAHLAHFRRRVLTDALQEATADYWERRAETFAAVGNNRCDEIATACRNKAQFVRDTGLDAQAQTVIDDILGHPLGATA